MDTQRSNCKLIAEAPPPEISVQSIEFEGNDPPPNEKSIRTQVQDLLAARQIKDAEGKNPMKATVFSEESVVKKDCFNFAVSPPPRLVNNEQPEQLNEDLRQNVFNNYIMEQSEDHVE